MAHLWVQHQGDWAVIEMNGAGLDLTSVRPGRSYPEGFAILRGPDGYYLVSRQGCEVSLNGRAGVGIRRLQDRDELRQAGRLAYFSTEELPQILPFDEGRETPCPRCRLAIKLGAASVRCPGCRAAYHQTEDLPCFNHAPQCALCSAETILGPDIEYGWSPEVL
jgi:hypothetical protein